MIANYVTKAKASWSSTIEALSSFLRRPNPNVRTTQSKLEATLWLFALSMLVTTAFAFAALPFVLTSESSAAGGLSNILDQPVATILVALVILGPMVEEMMFRGWLVGTWQALIGTLAFIALFYAGPTLSKHLIDAPLWALQVFFATLGLAIFYVLASLQPRSTIRTFESLFPLLFWGQGLVFGILHFRNLYSDMIVLPLLMTLPLVVCGWLWGYARVALGLPAALVLHMAYNIPSAIGMVLFTAMAA